MSKYWDPTWERPTAVLTFPRPGPDVVQGMVDSAEPWALEGAPKSHEVCWDGDRAVIANFGADATLLVPAPRRVETAQLQQHIGSLNY